MINLAIIDLKRLSVNTPQVRIQDYFWVIAGIPKAGKTTLFASLVEYIFGDLNKGLLLAFETGYKALRVQAQDIDEWNDFEEVVDQLVEMKDELGIEFIGIDTADVLYEMCEKHVISKWNMKNPSKRTDDIGGVGAKGNSDQGFGVGYKYVKSLIRTQIDRLVKAGYGIMVLTHDKDKQVEDSTGKKYDQKQVSLPTTAREIFVNMADFICFITIEKEATSKGKKVEGVSTSRYIYWRTDGFVEAGSRFNNVPERIEWTGDAVEFVQVFKAAVESEFEKGADIQSLAKQQGEERDAKAAEFIELDKQLREDDSSIDDVKEGIKNIFTSLKSADASKAKMRMKKILGTVDYINFDDASLLQEAYAALKNEFISEEN